MFMVINKDKIISYLISFSTVAILFSMSFLMTKNNENILETSTEAINNKTLINQTESNNIVTNKVKEESNNMEVQ